MSWKPGLLTWMHLKLWLTFLTGWTHPFQSHVCNHSICIMTFKMLWCWGNTPQNPPQSCLIPQEKLSSSASEDDAEDKAPTSEMKHLHILTAVTLPVAPKVDKTAPKSPWLTPIYFINSFSSSWSCFVRARYKKVAHKAGNIIQLSSFSGHSPDMQWLLFHWDHILLFH